MPRGIKGSGPFAGRGRKKTGSGGKRSTSLAEIAARSPNAGHHQQASNGTTTGSKAATGTGRGRGGKGRGAAGKSPARRGRGATANNGQQRADLNHGGTGNGGTEVMKQPGETNGVKIEVVAIPGRGGRPQQSEAFPFAALELSTKGEGGEMIGPSFLIPEDQNPDNVLAAARKRHKGKTFTARKMEGGVRIWRLT